jgi:hypothetical protein
MSLEWDWLMHATNDLRCREVQLWRAGVLDRLPPELGHSVVACAHDGGGWAILMTDHSTLFERPEALDAKSDRHYLNALAALHARFLNDPSLLDPELGLCEPARYVICTSPSTLSNLTVGDQPRTIGEAWRLLDECFEPENVHTIRSLHADPSPLCAALERFPQTLAHGDWMPRNLAVLALRPAKTLVIDWQFATRTAPAVDLARYLAFTKIVRPVPREDSIRYYRKCFERYAGITLNDEEWQAQVEIALLASVIFLGHLLMKAAVQDTRKRAELPWWERQVRAGAARL